MPSRPSRRRSGVFHVESTRLRSNVADQVQRDLLPAGRMLSVFLILCELFAEVAVLAWSRGQTCDRPLRFWLFVHIFLQSTTVILNCVNICQHSSGIDSLRHHRNGLSASEVDMYTDSPSALPPSTTPVQDVMVEVVHHQTTASNSTHDLFPEQVSPRSQDEEIERHLIQSSTQSHYPAGNRAIHSPSSSSSSHNERAHYQSLSESENAVISTQFADRLGRIINACYLVWFILSSIWVSDGGTCPSEAPHLYRLIVALTIIYYALLFLPLACFCLIVCCLPLFILIYRIMLPYAERERRRARAADPVQVQNLSSLTYSTEAFIAHEGSESLEDASCVICLCDYEEGEAVRFLPCKHHFHKDCVDVWLRLDKACCLCKQDIDARSPEPPCSTV